MSHSAQPRQHPDRPAPMDTEAPPASPLPAVMQQWLDYLEHQRRYAAPTLSAYRTDLLRLAACLGGMQPEQALNNHMRQYLARMHGQGMQPRALARMLAAWRGFYRWWAPQSGMAGNPTNGLRPPKAPRGLPKALSVEQAQGLMNHAAARAGYDAIATRDHAMAELFYSSGLRLSELVALDVRYTDAEGYQSQAWLDLSENEAHLLGKGGKRRIVPVGSHALRALQAWMDARLTMVPANAAPADKYALFLGARGRRIAPRIIQKQLAQLAITAGLPTHLHPHMLRHSFASHVLQSAQDLRAVQEMLGHASISTTQIYTRLDFQHLAQVYDQAHPRAKRRER